MSVGTLDTTKDRNTLSYFSPKSPQSDSHTLSLSEGVGSVGLRKVHHRLLPRKHDQTNPSSLRDREDETCEVEDRNTPVVKCQICLWNMYSCRTN